MVDMKETGRRVTIIRKARGLSQYGLASIADTAQSTICKAEVGEGSLELFDKIADSLDVTLRELLFAEDFTHWCEENCKLSAGSFVVDKFGRSGMVLPNKSITHSGEIKVIYADGKTEYMLASDCQKDKEQNPIDFFESV